MRALGFTVTGELDSRHRDLHFLQVKMFKLQLSKRHRSDCSGEGRCQQGISWKMQLSLTSQQKNTDFTGTGKSSWTHSKLLSIIFLEAKKPI